MVHAREDLACSFESLAVCELNTEVLRPILQACREGKRVDIQYAYLSSPEPEYRVIQPHTVVHSAYRWHVRVWCEKNGEFRDFVLSKISESTGITLPATHCANQNEAWNASVTLTLIPAPRLSRAQKAVIAGDYGMTNMQLSIPTRGALVSYVLQQLRVDSSPRERSPEAQQVVIKNRDKVARWLIDAS